MPNRLLDATGAPNGGAIGVSWPVSTRHRPFAAPAEADRACGSITALHAGVNPNTSLDRGLNLCPRLAVPFSAGLGQRLGIAGGRRKVKCGAGDRGSDLAVDAGQDGG